MKIGILAVQGAFIEHKKMFERLDVSCSEIRQSSDLDHIDGIVLPGGESTVQGKLIKKLAIYEPLRQMILDGLPTLATCAGLILSAEKIENDSVTHLATFPATVKRNAYGRQLGSFSATGDVGDIDSYPLIFIRAPYITSVADGVDILSTIDGNIVAAEYKNQLALSFHPELSDDPRIHEYFLKKIK